MRRRRMGPRERSYCNLSKGHILPTIGSAIDYSALSKSPMNAMTMQLVAAGLEVLGSFLLAAEAVKLCGLRWGREKLPIGALDPINSVARSGIRRGRRPGESWGLYVGLLILATAVLGDVFLILRGFRPADSFGGFRAYAPGLLSTDLLMTPPAAVVAFISLNFIESFLIEILSFPLLITMVLLRMWDRHSGSGAIGVLGFIFLLTGTSLRVYLDLLGG